ncbi:hypothetical protein [uncultured Sphingomonas sp.]|uniref:hypothetical protein n=1 Tax=uncultured Sphingomonas sp. TaxID=158754 RepID=UPI0035C9C11C
MLFTTPTQFIVLALALVGGWLLGLASHPGGRRWRERYAAERDAHAVTRRDAETKLAESNRLTTDARRGTDDRLIQANARIAELERENARLAKGTTVIHVARDEAEAPGDTPVFAARAAHPVYVAPSSRSSAGTKRGWFDWA